MKKIMFMAMAMIFAASTAHASVTTFSGIDGGASAPGVNSTTARAAFDSAANPTTEITFEDLDLGELPATGQISPGVYVESFGDVDWIRILDGFDLQLGFNTTVSGEKYLQFLPNFHPTSTPGMKWTFDIPINSWGAFLTGLNPNVLGVLHLLFNDGSSQDITVPDGSPNGGVQFFGFKTTGSIVSIDFELQGVDNQRDIFGIDDVVTAPVAPVLTVEKDYRYTDVCFEKDNDGDGLFSEDPVDFDLYDDPIDNDGDGLYNEDDIDCIDGTSLGAPLPIDDDGNYIVKAATKKNGIILNYNPGQYYAVSTVRIYEDIPLLIIDELFEDCCTLSALSPLTGGGCVVLVEVGADGVARQIADAHSSNISVEQFFASAELENVSAGTTLLMYVKFRPGLKGEAIPINNICVNEVNVLTESTEMSAMANLILIEKP